MIFISKLIKFIKFHFYVKFGEKTEKIVEIIVYIKN